MRRNNITNKIWIIDLQFFIKENIKGIFWTSIFMIITACFFLAPYESISNLFHNYKCEAKCIQISANAKEIIYQDMDGSKIEVHAYIVKYSYEVDETLYTNEKVINNNVSNSVLINLLVNGKTESLAIKFDCEKPENSNITVK